MWYSLRHRSPYSATEIFGTGAIGGRAAHDYYGVLILGTGSPKFAPTLLVITELTAISGGLGGWLCGCGRPTSSLTPKVPRMRSVRPLKADGGVLQM